MMLDDVMVNVTKQGVSFLRKELPPCFSGPWRTCPGSERSECGTSALQWGATMSVQLSSKLQGGQDWTIRTADFGGFCTNLRRQTKCISLPSSVESNSPICLLSPEFGDWSSHRVNLRVQTIACDSLRADEYEIEHERTVFASCLGSDWLLDLPNILQLHCKTGNQHLEDSWSHS